MVKSFLHDEKQQKENEKNDWTVNKGMCGFLSLSGSLQVLSW